MSIRICYFYVTYCIYIYHLFLLLLTADTGSKMPGCSIINRNGLNNDTVSRTRCVTCFNYIRVCVYMYVCMYVCVCMYICMCVCCACMYACVSVYVYVYVYVCICICIYIVIYIHIHTYIYIKRLTQK